MLKSAHATTLIKPYSQIKDLKLHHAEQLDDIKESHRHIWQIFKAFNAAVLQKLPADFAKPHVQNWCNGWEIRRHLFAYYKYDKYLGNAPIISVILNRQRLIIALTWHRYKAKISQTPLSAFNEWLNEIDLDDFSDFYFWHSSINEYQDFTPINALDYDKLSLADGEFYRLGKFIDKADLDAFTDDDLVDWAAQTICQLAKAYEFCHGKGANNS
ncbi:hypothetical protein B0181_08800 [Moraxella caviae]|uniref:Glucose-6-phosphate 1-dehydrogenase n=1 Tax=Moraxella caviae TaxID=34060 RepID=A0A1S9ZXI3_9GAMM|nr:HI_0552 family protein [Moraxella caviae]OOR88175.1 hypothetical protein B0181_08800 [Moraxella caviae]STZ10530.1 Glucose-6-phosphate 1-dehydrogenase [Moraxella caviae]